MIIQMDFGTETYDLASLSGLRTATYDRESQARGNPALEKTSQSLDHGLCGSGLLQPTRAPFYM